MTVASIRSTLMRALAESRGKSVDAVEDEIGAEGLIDSLEGVELVAAIEKEFGVKITDRELSSRLCSSIPRLVEAVSTKLQAKAEAQKGR